MLYELLSGQRAFSRPSVAETLSAILKEDPPSLDDQKNLSAGMVRIVSRCLQKAPTARFQSARDLAFALAEEEQRPPRIVNGEMPNPRMRWKWVGAATLVAIAVTVAAWSQFGGTQETPVADGPVRLVVLPFDNLSQQPADAWLAGAFSDTLTLNLRSAENLVLVDRARALSCLAPNDARMA